MIEDGEKGLQDPVDNGSKPAQHTKLEFVPPSLVDRRLIAQSFWTQAANPSSVPEATLVLSLGQICQPQAYILYCPGESPEWTTAAHRISWQCQSFALINA